MNKKHNTIKKYEIIFLDKETIIRPIKLLEKEIVITPEVLKALQSSYYIKTTCNSLEEAITVAKAQNISFIGLNKVEETLANIYLRRYYEQ